MTSIKEHEAFSTIKNLFAAMSAFDAEAMHATATPDFQLLEHGEDWTMQTLADAILSKGKTFTRRNFFQQIRAQDNGDSVWISYWNKAEFGGDESRGQVVWLESAVLIKVKGEWKIQMLHSTRLEKDAHPENISWAEYQS